MKPIDLTYRVILGAAILATFFCSAQVSTAPFWEIDPNDKPAWENAMGWSMGIAAILIFLRAVVWRFIEDMMRRGAGLSGTSLILLPKCATVVCALVFVVGLVGMFVVEQKTAPYNGLSAEEHLAAYAEMKDWSNVWVPALFIGGVCFLITAFSGGYTTKKEQDEFAEANRPLPGHTYARQFESYKEAEAYRNLHGYKPGYAYTCLGKVYASFKYPHHDED